MDFMSVSCLNIDIRDVVGAKRKKNADRGWVVLTSSGNWQVGRICSVLCERGCYMGSNLFPFLLNIMMIHNSPACSRKEGRKNDKGMTQAVGYNQDSGQQK